MSDRFVEQIAANRESEIRVLQLETETSRQRLLQAQQSLRAAQAKFRNATTAIETARRRAERINLLHADGLASLREKESEMLTLQKQKQIRFPQLRQIWTQHARVCSRLG